MPERIGRYEIVQELGRGAMGAVYLARDPEIGRTVAIKVILTAALPGDDLQTYKQRFRREAQAAGQMSHPGIVTIHDIAEDESGQPYLVMEYVEGTTLDRIISADSERLPLEQILDVITQVAEALDYAHRRGVVHRDIKPANILLTADGRAKILDFGIAKVSGAQLTQTGQLVGTPAFMSPEQFSGSAVDSRSDLFSLGALLYWMCTGEKPFAGDTLTAVSFKVVYSETVPARKLNPALPTDLDVVLARCLAKSPGDRYATARDLAADLAAIGAGRPVSAALPRAPADATTAQAVHAPPAPTPTPLEKTVAAPPEFEAQRTVPLLTQAKPALPWWKQRKVLAGLAALLLLLLMVGGYFLWPRPSAPTSAQKTARLPAPVETAREPAVETDSGPPPWSKGAGKGRRTSPQPVATSTLIVECRHNFRSATLEIFSDGRLLLDTALRGKETDLGVVKVFQGSVRTSAAIPAGGRLLRVRVKASREGYQEEEEIGGTFPENGSRTLLVEFGRGSALPGIDRQLTLRWK